MTPSPTRWLKPNQQLSWILPSSSRAASSNNFISKTQHFHLSPLLYKPPSPNLPDHFTGSAGLCGSTFMPIPSFTNSAHRMHGHDLRGLHSPLCLSPFSLCYSHTGLPPPACRICPGVFSSWAFVVSSLLWPQIFAWLLHITEAPAQISPSQTFLDQPIQSSHPTLTSLLSQCSFTSVFIVVILCLCICLLNMTQKMSPATVKFSTLPLPMSAYAPPYQDPGDLAGHQ